MRILTTSVMIPVCVLTLFACQQCNVYEYPYCTVTAEFLVFGRTQDLTCVRCSMQLETNSRRGLFSAWPRDGRPSIIQAPSSSIPFVVLLSLYHSVLCENCHRPVVSPKMHSNPFLPSEKYRLPCSPASYVYHCVKDTRIFADHSLPGYIPSCTE